MVLLRGWKGDDARTVVIIDLAEIGEPQLLNGPSVGEKREKGLKTWCWSNVLLSCYSLWIDDE